MKRNETSVRVRTVVGTFRVSKVVKKLLNNEKSFVMNLSIHWRVTVEVTAHFSSFYKF